MKKILIGLLFISVTLNSFSKELDSFKDISDSIKDGKNIKLVINLDSCTPTPPVSNLVVYTEARAIMLQPKYLQFANTPLTTNNPNFLNPKKSS
ncbi:MAG: VirK family protein [Neisseriaceae bacterium]|jgi:hypothetical protein